MRRRSLKRWAIPAGAILGLAGWGMSSASGQMGSAKVSQQSAVAEAPVTGAEPIYGTEYIPPTPEELKDIKRPEDHPAIQFYLRYNRMPKLDESGAIVGYVDARDQPKLTSEDSLIDVKDKDGNVVGVTGPRVIFQAVEK